MGKQYEIQAEKGLGDDWNSLWTGYPKKPSRKPGVVQMTPLSHKRPWMPAPLAKLESSLTT